MYSFAATILNFVACMSQAKKIFGRYKFTNIWKGNSLKADSMVDKNDTYGFKTYFGIDVHW